MTPNRTRIRPHFLGRSGLLGWRVGQQESGHPPTRQRQIVMHVPPFFLYMIKFDRRQHSKNLNPEHPARRQCPLDEAIFGLGLVQVSEGGVADRTWLGGKLYAADSAGNKTWEETAELVLVAPPDRITSLSRIIRGAPVIKTSCDALFAATRRNATWRSRWLRCGRAAGFVFHCLGQLVFLCMRQV